MAINVVTIIILSLIADYLCKNYIFQVLLEDQLRQIPLLLNQNKTTKRGHLSRNHIYKRQLYRQL